jgi:hypothetical protein
MPLRGSIAILPKFLSFKNSISRSALSGDRPDHGSYFRCGKTGEIVQIGVLPDPGVQFISLPGFHGKKTLKMNSGDIFTAVMMFSLFLESFGCLRLKKGIRRNV